MIPPGFIHDLIARTDIVELVGRSVDLKRAGTVHKGLCPFHAEKSPSFTVSPSRQTYHCFGCGAHGNAVGFLMEHHGMPFGEAVRDLAQQAGMVVPEDTRSDAERSAEAARRSRQATLSEVLAKAAEGYRKQLKGSDRAIAYLKRRGLSGEIAARYGLGYAAAGWRGLASVFPSYDDPLLEESGLVIARRAEGSGDGDDDGHGSGDGNGNAHGKGDFDGDGDVDGATPAGNAPEAAGAAPAKRYDRFRDRIMFPIRSVQGEVIAFGGRVLDQGEPKYLNSPETPVFVKGRELYGLYEARTAIRQRGYALVVEGYMDVVALAQSGFANAVATLGTACTAEHVQKLCRFTEAVVFSFDGDAAGRRAASRALEASLPHASDTRSFRFLFLPPEHDPDTFVRMKGDAAFERLVEGAVPLSRQLLEQAGQAGGGADGTTAEGRARFLANARPLWSALPQGMLKRQLLGEIAARAALPVDELAVDWKAGIAVRPRSAAAATATAAPFGLRRSGTRAKTAMRQPHDRVLWLLLLESGWWERLGDAEHALLCGLPGWHGEAFRYLDRQLAVRGPIPWAALREHIAAEPWVGSALALVDHEDPSIEPLLDDLHSSVAQIRRGIDSLDAMRVLGRA